MAENEFTAASEYRPKIPDGIYEAGCISHEKSRVFGANKLFLKFKIFGCKYEGVILFMAFTIPKDGRYNPGHKYYKKWCQVNNWMPPSRNTIMSPRSFMKKAYKIKTRTATPMDNGKDIPSMAYSVVDDIIEVIAG